MNNVLKDLHEAVSRKRGAGSKTEQAYVAYLCRRLPVTMIDEAGNLYVDLRTSPEHRTLFTAHTDTVSHGEGENVYSIEGSVWRATQGSTLGADDGAGIALLMHLIDRKVPALYTFFRNEEGGGYGSSTAAQTNMFDGIDRAIAFDRADYHDVITHQSGGRCCSEEFAGALAWALSNEEFTLAYSPCSQGVFTDTANLTDLVPECTNVSVGYFRQHSEHENQDVDFLQLLADKIVTIDWDALPVARKLEPRKGKYDKYYADHYADPVGAHSDALYDALAEAMDGDTTAIKEELVQYFGEEYRRYIRDLVIPFKALDLAAEAAADYEAPDYVLSLLIESLELQ